jgi:hypothetical protein
VTFVIAFVATVFVSALFNLEAGIAWLLVALVGRRSVGPSQPAKPKKLIGCLQPKGRAASLTLPQTPGRWKCPEVQLAALALFRRRSGRVRWGRGRLDDQRRVFAGYDSNDPEVLAATGRLGICFTAPIPEGRRS